jgi:chaperonin cofactor prefoldin
LTLEECKTLPDDAKTYETVGRMFVQTPFVEMKEKIGKVIVDTEVEVKSLTEQKAAIEKKVEQTQKEFSD